MSQVCPSIFVAVPCQTFGGYRPFDVVLAQFLKQHPEAEVHYGMTGVIPGARNRLVREAFKAQDAYVASGGQADDHRIWWLDDDQPFHPDDFSKLLAHNLDAVIPLSVRRGAPFLPLIYDAIDQDGMAHQHFLHDHERGLIPIVSAGMAGLLIRTTCFRTMGENAWFEFLHPPHNPDDYAEDFPFYKKLQAAGIRLFCDLETRFGHAVTSVVYPIRQNGKWMSVLADHEPFCAIPQIPDPLINKFGIAPSEYHGLTRKTLVPA